MNHDLLFRIFNLFAMIGWAFLFLLPRHRLTRVLVHSGLWSVLLCVAYTVVLLFSMGQAKGSFGSFAGVQQLFSFPGVVLAGWIHYLAFDLFIGAWEARDAQALGLPHLAMLPVLLLTLFFGPCGLLLYVIIRLAKTGSFKESL